MKRYSARHMSTCAGSPGQMWTSAAHRMALVMGLVMLPVMAVAATIHVPADQPTIQAGINAAVNGDTVLIAPGTYYEKIDFIGKSICVKGEFGSDSTSISSHTPTSRLVSFDSGEDTLSILDGFRFENLATDVNQGLIRLIGSSGTVRNCSFLNNHASSWPLGACLAIEQLQGGLLISEDNMFVGDGNTGSIGIAVAPGQGRINRCYFRNIVDLTGGAAVSLSVGSSNYLIENSVFVSNRTAGAYFASGGAGIFLSETVNATIRNNTFVSNTDVSADGGAIGVWYSCSGIVIEKNIFFRNSGYAVANQHGSSVTLNCNDAFLNTPGDYLGALTPDSNSFSADPLFCDTLNGNYGLRNDSPCAPGQNACGSQIGAFGVVCGPAALCSGWQGLFCDDFENGLNPLWTQNGDCTWETAGGVLHTSLVGQQLRCSIAAGSSTWTDYVLEYDIRGNAGADKPVAFRCDSSRFYDLSIRPDPRNDVILSGSNGWLKVVSYSSFNGIWYHVKIACIGNHITVSIDGTEVIDFVDDRNASASGGIALGCYTGGVEISDVSWDNVFVNATNTAPTAVSLSQPANTIITPITILRPQFVWTPATDPDPLDSITYDLVIAIDSNFVFVQQISNLTATSHTLTSDLLWGMRYWWKVKSVDQHSAFNWSPVFTFRTMTLGDANNDGSTDISDVVYLIAYIFSGGSAPSPLLAGDANCDDMVDISDVVYLIAYIFAGGSPPCSEF